MNASTARSQTNAKFLEEHHVPVTPENLKALGDAIGNKGTSKAYVTADKREAALEFVLQLKESSERREETSEPVQPASVRSAEDTKPIRELVAMIVSRGADLDLEMAMGFLGKTSPDSPVTKDEAKRLIEEYRTRVAEGQQLVVKPRLGRFGRISARHEATRRKPTPEDYDIVETIWKRIQDTWKRMDGELKMVREERMGFVAYRCSLIPKNLISLELTEFRQLKKKGELPPVADESVEAVAEMLAEISLFNKSCRLCKKRLFNNYKMMVRRMLAKELRPPLLRLDPRELANLGLENAQWFRFYGNHRYCLSIYDMMSRVEEQIGNVEEGPDKEALRAKMYKEELRRDRGEGRGTLLAELIQSKIYDHSRKQLRPMNKTEVAELMELIHKNIIDMVKEETA